jgi:hypothetical protein
VGLPSPPEAPEGADLAVLVVDRRSGRTGCTLLRLPLLLAPLLVQLLRPLLILLFGLLALSGLLLPVGATVDLKKAVAGELFEHRLRRLLAEAVLKIDGFAREKRHSGHLDRVLVVRIVGAIGGGRSQLGLLLIGHGQTPFNRLCCSTTAGT